MNASMRPIIVPAKHPGKQLFEPAEIAPMDLFLNERGEVCVAIQPIIERLVKDSGIRCAKLDAETRTASAETFVLKIGQKYFPY